MKYRFIANAVLSAVLLAGGALSSPVLAENTNTGSTQINYTVDESYAWTAPASITFTADSNGSEAKTATIEVTQNTIGSGKTLKIGIANDQVFDLTDSTNGTNKREYTVKDGSTTLSAGSEVLSLEAGTNTGKKDLTLQVVQAPVEVAGSYAGTLKFVSTIEESGSGSATSNPYSAKISSVQKLYDVRESALTSDDIVTVNGVECYVLQADDTKAELITVDIYDQRFNATNTGAASEYTYETADIKTYMDNFYTNQLGSDPYILDTEVTYRYKSSYDSDLSTYSTGTVSQKVFALDAVEAQTNKSKFSWNYNNKMNGNGIGFWVAAGCSYDGNSFGWDVDCYGRFNSNYDVPCASVGARPAFWISLAD